MTNNQSLLERYCVVLDKTEAAGLERKYKLYLRRSDVGALRGYWVLESAKSRRDIADTKTAIIAVLEKWLKQDVAPWAEGETGPTIFFPHMSEVSWRWMIAGVAQGRNDDTDLAHLELAEAICDYLETSK